MEPLLSDLRLKGVHRVASLGVLVLFLAGCTSNRAAPPEPSQTRTPIGIIKELDCPAGADCLAGFTVNGRVYASGTGAIRPDLVADSVSARGTVDGCAMEMRSISGVDPRTLVATTYSGRCREGGSRWQVTLPPGGHPADLAALNRAVCIAGYPVRSAPDCQKPNSPASYLTGRWNLISINQRGHEPLDASTVGAGAQFALDGSLGLDDGVNHTSGRFQPSPHGFVIHGRVGSTTAGYIGKDAAKLATIEAVRLIAYPDRSASESPEVRTKYIGDRLFLYAGPYVLTYRSHQVDDH